MKKMIFDDKPEANTYVKWAREKGYLVEGPYREKLSKKAKKFDLNGKPKKYQYVVLGKRGVGIEGGAADDAFSDYAPEEEHVVEEDKGETGKDSKIDEYGMKAWEGEDPAGYGYAKRIPKAEGLEDTHLISKQTKTDIREGKAEKLFLHEGPTDKYRTKEAKRRGYKVKN